LHFKNNIMREIKFRVQAVDNSGQKYWIEFDLFKSLENPIAKGDAYGHTILKETVSQFTGLKDKNGVEIWEGDIMQHANSSVEPMPIVYNKKHAIFCFDDGYYSITDSSFEVIGNIFDNKELIS